MINYGNIPAPFKWTDIQEDGFFCFFEPNEGVVEPKSELFIRVKFTANIGSPAYHIF